MGIARRTIVNLDGYEAQIRPLMVAVEKAREAQQSVGDQLYGVSGAVVGGSGKGVGASLDPRRGSYDVSRDPRVRGPGL